MLTRGASSQSDRGGLVLRVELAPGSEAAAEEELAELITDLRLLGLRPMLVSEQTA